MNPHIQELKELGLKGSTYRIVWELSQRIGISMLRDKIVYSCIPVKNHRLNTNTILEYLPFKDVGEAFFGLDQNELEILKQQALAACEGKITCFGKWTANYNNPIDWELNPVNNKSWNNRLHCSNALQNEGQIGDIKLSWEIGRFPHAYAMVRAAKYYPELKERFSLALQKQIESFIEANPLGLGIHWASGQEIVIRMMAWLFAACYFWDASKDGEFLDRMFRSLLYCGHHIKLNISYAKHAVYNNHLLSEALGLFLLGSIIPDYKYAEKWRSEGREILIKQASRQFYKDGGYIQQSHTYHRVALQYMLCAIIFAKSTNQEIPQEWMDAVERSTYFLYSFQNLKDGSLPNYGANDGAQPYILTNCDYVDFRPILQTATLLTKKKRLYDPGQWDEEAWWLLGSNFENVPIVPIRQQSQSYFYSGHHVLRGEDQSSFLSFRCGSLRDRFSQIDMLHTDLWYKGQNIFCDGGSYLYNGDPKWNNYFIRTSSHNTVTIDNEDQMLHYRKFKTLYTTKAKTLDFKETEKYCFISGEHYGYQRLWKDVIHRRSILAVKDGIWVIIDTIFGSKKHDLRLHWLCGDYPNEFDSVKNQLTLTTPTGNIIAVVKGSSGALQSEVIMGQEQKPRGWLSRYYGYKIAVPSWSINVSTQLPYTFITIVSDESADIRENKENWHVQTNRHECDFSLQEGLISKIQIH